MLDVHQDIGTDEFSSKSKSDGGSGGENILPPAHGSPLAGSGVLLLH